MDGVTVTLNDDDAELAARLVAEGRYGSAAEDVQAAMTALRDNVDDRWPLDWDAIKAAATEGEAALTRGDYVEFDSDAELKAHFDRMLARIATNVLGVGQDR